MNDRDQIEALTRILLTRRMHTNMSGDKQRADAEAILREGWRPPVQVIEDPADLDALPVGSTVLDDENPPQAHSKGDSGDWYTTRSTLSLTSCELLRFGGPATVAYVPTETGDTNGQH